MEVIGGADKYMAVCRNCYNMPFEDRCQNETPTKRTHQGKKLNMTEEVTASC